MLNAISPLTLWVPFFRYTPQVVDIQHKMKPFIPDYIPCVGDIDAMLKVKGNPESIFEPIFF